MRNKKAVAIVIALFVFAALAVAALSPASAKRGGRHGERPNRAAHTKMRFKLDDHHWDSGATVTGTVALRSGKGRGEPLIDAMVRVLVDGTEVGIAVTDGEGKATVSWGPATDGGHVMRVVFDGDDIHKRAKRAQGFHVGTGDDDEGDLEATPTPTPTPEPETTPTP